MEGFIVSTPYIIATRFASMGIELCITGHSHLNDVKSFTDAFGRTVYDFSMSALSEFPAEYKLFTVDDSGIITPLSAGTTTVKITMTGGFTDTVTVTVE